MQKTPRSKWIRFGLLVLVVIGAFYFYSVGAFSRDNLKRLFDRLPEGLQPVNPFAEELEPLLIGMVVPEAQTDFASELKRTVELFEQKMAAQNGVNRQPVKVIFYSNQYDTPDEAVVTAQKVLDENRVLLMIGHFYSNSSMQVGQTYAGAGIPIITSSAGSPEITQNNPWFFRTLSNNSTMASYAALYTAKVLNYPQASVVYEDNQFGESLYTAFRDTFTQNGGTVAYAEKMTHLTALDEVGKREAETILEKMTQPGQPSPGIVFLALNDNEAIQFILAMRAAKQRFPLIGAYDQGDANFAGLFAEYPQEKSQPGYFTDGMYAFSPLIYDISNEQAHDFYDEYLRAFGTKPTWLGATTYDALLMAVHAIQVSGATGQPEALPSEREKIRDALDSFNSSSRSVDGLTTGHVYFDQEHNVSRPPVFGVFNKRNFISAPIQLTPIQDTRLVPNLAKSDILHNEGQNIYQTRVAYTGVKINSITNLDVDRDHSFIMDFYLWFRYQGEPQGMTSDEVESVDSIEFMNAVDPISLGSPISEFTDEHGLSYRLYRVRAKFRTTSDLEDFPFDRQQLFVQFRHKSWASDRLIYVEDILGMDNAASLIARFKQDNVFTANSDWDLVAGRIFIDVYSNKASLGNPILLNLNSRPNIENSQFNVLIDIQRNTPRFMLKTMLPLFCLVALAYLSLFLPEYKFDVVTSIMTGTVLSIVFFHVNLSNRLNVGYNVALDYVFYSTYGLFVLELLLALLAWHSQSNQKLAGRFMWLARILYPTILIAAGTAILWLYTNSTGKLVLDYLKTTIPGI